MARTVRDTNLETRAARRRLTARHKPYWRLIDQGRHLGYFKGKRGGAWIARYFLGAGRYAERKLGTADDTQDADGVGVLSFQQAQAEARGWFSEQARKVAGIAGTDGPYTVTSAIEDYLADYQGRGGKAVEDARTRAEALILPSLGSIEVSKLTAKQIKDWQNDLAEAPPRLRTRKGETQRFRDTNGDPEAIRRRRATANRTLTILKAALNHAWAESKVASDDAWRRVKPFREADAARVHYLKQDQIIRLVNGCDPDFRPLVQAALFTGCRYGELAAIRTADFNPDDGTVLIRHSKAGKARHVVLTDEGQGFFEAVTAGQEDDKLMFTKTSGKPWGRTHQQRPLREACQRAGITPPANFHILRHSYASLLVMAGVPLVVVAKNLGHSDTRMCERHYAHLAPSYVADTIRAHAPKLGIANQPVSFDSSQQSMPNRKMWLKRP